MLNFRWHLIYAEKMANQNSILIGGSLCILLAFTSIAYSDSFVKGEILVGFHDDVNEFQASSLITSFGLSWESKFPELFGIFAEYDSEVAEERGFELKTQMANKIMEEDRKLAQYPYTNYLVLNVRVVNNGKILVMFNNRATEEQAKSFIAQFEGLKFMSFDYAPKWGIVKVPLGEEQKWIETFNREQIVKYAELNSLAMPSSTDSQTDNFSNYPYVLGAIIAICLVALFYILRKRKIKFPAF